MYKSHPLEVFLSVLVVLWMTAAPLHAQTTPFTDVSSQEWFAEYVGFLTTRNIVSGYPNNEFRPHRSVTRAEFATILAHGQNLPTQPTQTRFNDLSAGHWASGAVESVANQGWIKGYPDGSYRPNQPISIPEMYTISAQILSVPMVGTDEANRILAQFSDGAGVPGWAKQAVATAVKNGVYISEVTPNKIDPFSNATRAEVATTIAKVLNESYRTPVPIADADSVSFVGRLHRTVEEGGWIAENLEDGKKYLLLQLGEAPDQRWWREGRLVRVRGTIDEDASTIYMEGTPLAVDVIEPVTRSAGSDSGM